MEQHGVRRLPVVRDGRLVGLVSWGDLRAAQPSAATTLSVHEWRALLEKASVDECMSRKPISIGPDEPVLHAAQQMLRHKLSGLPVVLGDRVVGVITESDLFRLLIAELTGASVPDPARTTITCAHCGATLRWRADRPVEPDEQCWRCHNRLRPRPIHYTLR
jgi:CBS domain-containing protein